MSHSKYGPFDPDLGPFLSDEPESESGDEGHPLATCKFCGMEELEWDVNHHDVTGKWRLWEGAWPTGKPHVCKPAASKDFEPL